MEDSAALAEVLVEGLRDQGMAVDAAHDGLEAAAKLDVNSYDVVVLDRDLPGLPGDVLCQMITGSDQRAMVIMLTAAGAPPDRVAGLGLGPMTTWASRSTSRNSCCGSGRWPAGSLRRGPGCCEAAGSNSTRCGVPPPATGGRWSCRSRSSGCSRRCCAPPRVPRAEDLLEQVWDEQADPFTNTVAVTSAGCAASSATRRSSAPPPASATASPPSHRSPWPLLPGSGGQDGDPPTVMSHRPSKSACSFPILGLEPIQQTAYSLVSATVGRSYRPQLPAAAARRQRWTASA